MCKENKGLFCVIELFFLFEEMWKYCIMGRGRKGALNQSMKKMRPNANGGIAKVHGRLYKSDEKISLHEETLAFIKNMNQQELVDFLLSNDWHVKTSGIDASGC